MADAHLVGSMNFNTADEVFRIVSEISGECVTRIPDGETGARRGWIFHQVPRMAANPALTAGPGVPNTYVQAPGFTVRDGIDPADVTFDLGFGVTAVESYPRFRSLKEQGFIRPDAKFQVALPTQVAVLGTFVSLPDQSRLAGAYELALAADVAKIAETVPSDELAIQWDVSAEFAIIEGAFESVHTTDALLDQLGRMAALVPGRVELGFHLCYGSAPSPADGIARHFVQPKDAANLVMVIRGITDRVQRPIGFLHLPVPVDRDDDGYFEPLRDLRLPADTRLYLGLVHQDGLENTQRRVDTAARHVTGFGVATECGMGTTPRSAIPELLRLHRDVVVPAT